MPRRPRSELPDGLFHVTTRGLFGLSVFHDEEDRRRFLYLLGEVTARYSVRCLAYCVMGTHYHLVLACRTATLPVAMRRLNGRYAQQFNRRHGRSGHVWAGRYSSYVIRDEEHLTKALEYIAANPVVAGLCETIEDWPWTWIGGETDPRGSKGAVPVPPSPRAPRRPAQTAGTDPRGLSLK